MFITVTCPKCGRSIKAKKKFALAAGGVPCLKCKIRIPLTTEQVEEAEDKTEAAAPAKSNSGPLTTLAAGSADANAADTRATPPPVDETPAEVKPLEVPLAAPETAPSPEVEEHPIPTVFAPLREEAEAARRPTESSPPADAAIPPEAIPQGASAMVLIADLRSKLAEAEERAHSAELALQQLSKEKATSEVTAVRRIRELEAQVKELTARLKAREEEYRATGLLKRSDVAVLLQNLNAALDENFRQEMVARQNALEDLKRQLNEMLPH